MSYSTNYWGNPPGMNVSGSAFVTAYLALEAGKYAVKKAERNGKTALRFHDSQNW